MGMASFVAVCDTVEQRALAAQRRWNVPAAYTDLDRMLSREPVDLVINATPIPVHYEVTLAALNAGRHVYSQKPLATTFEEAARLVDEARDRELVLAGAPEHPVRPAIRTARGLLADGAIGQVCFAKIQTSHFGPEKQPVDRDSTWYYRAGAGPLFDLGAHGLSELTSLLGPVERVACRSARSSAVRRIEAGPFAGKWIDVKVDDEFLLLLDFGGGVLASLEATYCVEATRSPRLEIHGTRGTICLTGPTASTVVEVFEPAAGEWRNVEVLPGPATGDLGVHHMVDCLRTGTEPVLSARRALHLVDVMTTALRSAEQSRTLAVDTRF
jgi:predicted dehydrogenase